MATKEETLSQIYRVINSISSSAGISIRKTEGRKIFVECSGIRSDAREALQRAFTENGINGVGSNYYYRINGQQTLQIDTRVKQLYLLRDGATDCAISLFAELTTIDSYMMPFLTGSVDGITSWNGVG